MEERIISGVSTGFVDFPGRYAVTAFLPGCNLRCPFCCNESLLDASGDLTLSEFAFFVGKLSTAFLSAPPGICFSGGEPAISPVLTELVETFLHYPLAIHTNGLVIPEVVMKHGSPFEAVILSVKPMCAVEGHSRIEYVSSLELAMRIYEGAKHKELRVVNLPGFTREHQKTLSMLPKDLGWEVNFVEPIGN